MIRIMECMSKTIGQRSAGRNNQIHAPPPVAAAHGMSDLVRVPPLGEARDRELLKHAVTYAYRETDSAPLHAHFFFPADFRQGDRRPLVVFFHGGFWDASMRTQFAPHCNQLASRGAIAVAAETRLASSHSTGPIEALDDARSLLLWISAHAETLGIDPARVVTAGSAGGAWLALADAMLPTPEDTLSVARPRALVLFSPLVDTTPRSEYAARFPDPKIAKLHSPTKLIRKELPPSILFHGKADRLIPFDSVSKFARTMQRKRNQCELIDFERADHSFFNYNVSQEIFELTMGAADRFLVEHGILDPRDEDDF
jgi:acetyl esterase